MTSNPRFFDAHTHAQFQVFGSDYKEVIGRALGLGVGMVNVGTQKDTSLRAVEIAREYENENIFAAVGLHPIHTSKSFHDEQELGGGEAAKAFTSRGEEFDYEYYKKLAGEPKVVAIGECGLDYYRVKSHESGVKKKQAEAFLAQIELAREVRKPLMIHCRDGKKSGTGQAFDDLVDILRANAATPPFISHSFVRDVGVAKKLLDLGSYFSFNGIITFARDYDDVVRFLPADRILSETDAPYILPEPYRSMARERGRGNGRFPAAEKRVLTSGLKPLGFKEERSDDAPYLTPAPYRGERNEPAYVVEVVKKLAELRGVSLEKMSEQIWENAKRVFLI
jgi:TatD DNase family protein